MNRLLRFRFRPLRSHFGLSSPSSLFSPTPSLPRTIDYHTIAPIVAPCFRCFHSSPSLAFFDPEDTESDDTLSIFADSEIDSTSNSGSFVQTGQGKGEPRVVGSVGGTEVTMSSSGDGVGVIELEFDSSVGGRLLDDYEDETTDAGSSSSIISTVKTLLTSRMKKKNEKAEAEAVQDETESISLSLQLEPIRLGVDVLKPDFPDFAISDFDVDRDQDHLGSGSISLLDTQQIEMLGDAILRTNPEMVTSPSSNPEVEALLLVVEEKGGEERELNEIDKTVVVVLPPPVAAAAAAGGGGPHGTESVIDSVLETTTTTDSEQPIAVVLRGGKLLEKVQKNKKKNAKRLKKQQQREIMDQQQERSSGESKSLLRRVFRPTRDDGRRLTRAERRDLKSVGSAAGALMSDDIVTDPMTKAERKDIQSVVAVNPGLDEGFYFESARGRRRWKKRQYTEYEDFDAEYEDPYEYVYDERYSQVHEDSYFYVYELLAANVGMFLLMQWVSEQKRLEMERTLSLSLHGLVHGKRWWSLFTHQFLHAGWVHLMSNMAVLALSGGRIVRHIGPKGVVGIFLGGSVLGGVGYLAEASYRFYSAASRYTAENDIDKNAEGADAIGPDAAKHWVTGCIGASGGCYALLMAHLLFDPHPVMMVYLLGYEVIGFLAQRRRMRLGISADGPEVAHSGHLGGALLSIVRFRYLVPRLFSSVWWGSRPWFLR